MLMRKILLVVTSLLFLSGSVVMAGAETLQPPATTPNAPITQDQAIGMALVVAKSWGEPAAVVQKVEQKTDSSLASQLKAGGDEVQLAGTGDVMIVHFSGKFTPGRGALNGASVQCTGIHVIIRVNVGDVVAAGCE